MLRIHLHKVPSLDVSAYAGNRECGCYMVQLRLLADGKPHQMFSARRLRNGSAGRALANPKLLRIAEWLLVYYLPESGKIPVPFLRGTNG